MSFLRFHSPNIKTTALTAILKTRTKYVASAFEKGAIAAVVRQDRFEEHRAELEKYKDKLLFVKDAILALQRLAHGVYLEWNKPVVAVTGSAGKTTAKELTAHVLESSAESFKEYQELQQRSRTSFDGFKFGSR